MPQQQYYPRPQYPPNYPQYQPYPANSYPQETPMYPYGQPQKYQDYSYYYASKQLLTTTNNAGYPQPTHHGLASYNPYGGLDQYQYERHENYMNDMTNPYDPTRPPMPQPEYYAEIPISHEEYKEQVGYSYTKPNIYQPLTYISQQNSLDSGLGK